MNNSENITTEALSLAVNDKFPCLNLEFVEHNDKTNQSYPVDMNFKNIKYIDHDRIVLYGYLIFSLKPFGMGAIEYHFKTQNFYRVSYSDKTTHSRIIHTLLPHNDDVIKSFLSFILNNFYAK